MILLANIFEVFNLINKKGKTMRTVSTFLMICLALGVNAQSKYKLNSNSSLTISGTSTLHDWTIVAEEMTGSANIDIKDGTLNKMSDLNLKVTTKEIKSGKSGMDNNTFKALKADEFTYVTFTLTESNITKQSNNYLVKSKGKLMVAGVTKTIDISSTCDVDKYSVKCKGSYTMNMTDFNVEPPTAMFGTIKTGDQITINFESTFNNSDITKLLTN